MPLSSEKPNSPSLLGRGLRAVSAAAIAAVLAATGGSFVPSTANAQGFFSPWESPAYRYRKPAKVKRPPADGDDAAEARSSKKSGKDKGDDVAEREQAQGPLVITVSLARQRLTVYDANGAVTSSPISSGRVGYATPAGVYTIVQKRRMHFSNLYESAPMPNMQRLTWSGVALHAGALPGYAASHGCVRLPHGFSKKLFGMTKMGTRVIIARDPVAPELITHDKLFKAFPPEGDVASGGDLIETRVADASGMLGITTAAAAAPDAAAPVANSFRERRRIEAAKLQEEIRTGGYAKAEKENHFAQAKSARETTGASLKAARSEAERLESQLQDLETSLASAQEDLTDLQSPQPEKGKRKTKKAMDASKRIAKIKTLEERVARLPAEIEAIRASHQHADEALRAAETADRDADEKFRIAKDELADATATLAHALAKEEAARKMETMRSLPVSIFISRAKQRLYIRQGFDDVLDTPVTFDRAEEPIGTHIFTALSVAENKADMKWSVASIPYDPTRTKKKTKQAKDQPAAPAVDLASQTAASALDRITIPSEIRDQISDIMKPGSSIVISDLGIGNETGAFTDFIVPIR